MNNKNTVVLARVSSQDQEQTGYSLDAQYKLSRDYCTRKELIVVKEFLLTENASSPEKRKIFRQMMQFAAIKKNNVTHIVVEKADRYTRNFKDAVLLDEWLAANDERRLHSIKEDIILHVNAKSDVKFMWNINIAAAKRHTDNLREEVKKGYLEKLAQGWLPDSPPPGYMNVKGNGKHVYHAPNPETKSIVVRAFKKYLEPGESLASIVQFLERSGLRNRNGQPHNKTRVHKILRNPYYIGIIRYDGKEYPGAHQPIISKDLFERVQKKIHGNKPSRYRHHNPVFKGIIRCKNCGGLVTWQPQKGRFYGACQRTTEGCKGRKLLREDRVEAEVTAMLKQLVCPSQEIIQWVADTIHDQQQDNIQEKEALCKSINTQLERIERMDERLYDDKLSGDISPEKYAEKHTEFGRQKTELRQRLDTIDQSARNRLDHVLVLLELSQKAAQIYTTRTPEQKRLIITKLFDNIQYDHNILSVRYTEFAKTIAKNVEETEKLIGGQK